MAGIQFVGAQKGEHWYHVGLAWADASRIPVIVCIEKNGNPHDANYVCGLATYIVTSLNEGIAVTRCFFNVPVKDQKFVFDGLDADGNANSVHGLSFDAFSIVSSSSGISQS